VSGAVVSAFAEVGLKDTGVAAGLENLLSRVVGFKNALVGTIAGGAVIAGFAKLTSEIFKVVDSLDELRDRARETQTPIEQLSEIEFAGRLNGISDVSGMLNFLTKNLGLAANGNKELAESFSQLGIDAGSFVRSGQPAANLMAQILDKLKAMPGGAAAAMATSVFGRGGFDVMRFGSGADFNRDLQSARDSGATVTQKQADAADALNDEIAKLSASFSQLSRDAVMPLIPAMTMLVERLNGTRGAELTKASSTVVGAAISGGNIGDLASGINNLILYGIGSALGRTEDAANEAANAMFAFGKVVASGAEAERERAKATQGIPRTTELGARPGELPASAEDMARLEESRALLRQAESAAAWNRVADAMDEIGAQQAEVDKLSRSSMPALMDAGSYWSTAQSAIQDDTKRQALKVAQESLERQTGMLEHLRKIAENGGQALTMAP